MILPRYYLDSLLLDFATPGSWYDTNHETLIAKTLELPWRNNKISENPKQASCIPAGLYLVKQEQPNERRPYFFYRIVHVPGRHFHPDIMASSCLVHPANYAEQLLGCIAPGSRHIDLNNDGIIDIADSKIKLAWMAKHLPKVFELEVSRRKP